MRPTVRLAALVLLAACGPKLGPLDGPDGSEGSDGTSPDTTEDARGTVVDVTGTDGADGGRFRWEDDFGSIELQDGLAGRSVVESERGGWESRSTRAPARSHATAAPTGGAADTDYEDDLGMGVLDTTVAIGTTATRARGSGGYGGGAGRGLARPKKSVDRAPSRAAPPTESYAMADAEPAPAPELEVVEEAVSDRSRRVPTGSDGSRPRPVPQPSLKAGTTDDNADFDGWLRYVQKWGARGDIAGWADTLDVTGRRYVQVVDARGRPVPDARVSVLDPTSERVVWAGRGYGDGRVPLYPQLKVPGRALAIAGDAPAGGWLVQASTADGSVRTVRWDGQSAELDVVVDTDGLAAGAPVPVDVCFIIDTTGSMGDEIDRIKGTLLSVTDKLRADASQGVDLRYGAVLYRDIGDEYVTRRHAFTADLEGFDRALQTIRANGGGDGPESLNQGLAVGVAGMDWRDGAARVAFVIADAPPHMDYQEDVTYGRAAAAAAHRGIRVHTVAASGLDDRGSYAFRQIAQLTRGQFIYIEYGSSAASAADHGVSGPTSSNNLDDIVYGRIRAEIDGWGKDGTEKVARR